MNDSPKPERMRDLHCSRRLYRAAGRDSKASSTLLTPRLSSSRSGRHQQICRGWRARSSIPHHSSISADHLAIRQTCYQFAAKSPFISAPKVIETPDVHSDLTRSGVEMTNNQRVSISHASRPHVVLSRRRLSADFTRDGGGTSDCRERQGQTLSFWKGVSTKLRYLGRRTNITAIPLACISYLVSLVKN